jgi:hypothetical protein
MRSWFLQADELEALKISRADLEELPVCQLVFNLFLFIFYVYVLVYGSAMPNPEELPILIL